MAKTSTQPQTGEEILPSQFNPVSIDARPHEGTAEHPGGQKAILDACLERNPDGSRVYNIVTVCVGRRAGKTVLDGFALHELGARCYGRSRVFNAAYAAQGHPQAEEFYEWIKSEWAAAGLLLRHKNKGQDRWILSKPFGNNLGVRLWCWSAEEGAHDNTRGKGLDLFMGDECGFWPVDAWLSTFLPMLGDRKGLALLTGTAKPEGVGFAWFRDIWLAGRPGKLREEDHISFSAPSESNPTVDPDFFAKLRAVARKKGKDVERSEFDGVFVEDTGGVFTNIQEVCSVSVGYRDENRAYAENFDPDSTFVVGIDWGRHEDWTRVMAFDRETKEQAAMLSFFDVDYDTQFIYINRLLDELHNPLVVADARETGSYLCRRLTTEYGRPVIPVKWAYGGEDDKSLYVTRGMDQFQGLRVKLFDLEEIKEEFLVYSKRSLPNATGWRYEAPSGKHDDIVSAYLFAARILHDTFQPTRGLMTEPDPFTRDWFLKRTRQKRRGRRRRVSR